MRYVLKAAVIMAGMGVSLMAVNAQAGDCRNGVFGSNCQSNVVIHSSMSLNQDVSHIYNSQPMGHLKTVKFLGAPSVNITRVHDQGAVADLHDTPTAFTGGCHPQSTRYCRSGGMVQARAQHMPLTHQPSERVVSVGKGYDPLKFIPRIYGSTELVRGIAHIPTSIVDRSPANAQAALNQAMMRPQTHIVQGAQNVYPGSMGADGTYWEQVPGAPGSNVICKRQGPVITPAAPVIHAKPQVTRVVRPVVAVRVPVPTPIYCQPRGPMAHGMGMSGLVGGRYGY